MGRLGFWAAVCACMFAIAYDVPQVLQVLGLLPDPIDRILIFAPSLALAPSFVVALASASAGAQGAERPWRTAALAVGIVYAAMVSIVYANQLGVVIPRELAGLPSAGHVACCGFREPMTVIDLTGYTYMSLATLLLAPTYGGATRWLLALNGVIGALVFLQLVWPGLIWAASAWIFVFPAAMALVARDMRRAQAA